MSQLIVLGFEQDAEAKKFVTRLQDLQAAKAVGISDLVRVRRLPDGKVRIYQAETLTGVGALSGAFWGVLIGLIFLMPWVGMAAGAVAGAVAGYFADFGISDEFMREVARTVKPGETAVFILADRPDTEALTAAMVPWTGKVSVITTNLTEADQAQLAEMFGTDSPAAGADPDTDQNAPDEEDPDGR